MPISKDRILYCDDSLLIVTKLTGELVVSAPGDSSKKPLFDYLRQDYPGLKVVHRLDAITSGVLVFARNAKVLEQIRSSGFEKWDKRYIALVHGQFTTRRGEMTSAVPARTGGAMADATTLYNVLSTTERFSLLELTLKTGRKHQIRRHLQSIKHSLVLDPLYGEQKKDRGFKKHLKYRRPFLHASALTLPHPVTGEEIKVKAPLPKHFLDVIEILGLRSRRT